MTPKRLRDVSEEEQRSFFNSFDTVLSDVDGVLWHLGASYIDGAIDGMNALRKIKKKIYFVTNNNTTAPESYLKIFQPMGGVKEELIRPAQMFTWYLKSINFDKEVYVVGFKALKNELQSEGFKVVYDEVEPVGETFKEIDERMKTCRSEVGAVIIDIAVNMDYMMLQKCVDYINKNKALFLAGCWDPVVPVGGYKFIGNPYFVNAIHEITKVPPKILTKSGKEFEEVILEHFKFKDPKRVLFLGDSLVTDMAFADSCGFQKLLPLTGLTKDEDLNNLKETDVQPDYVIDSVKDLAAIINNLELND